MLVRRCMKDDLRLALAENLHHAICIADVGNGGVHFERGKTFGQLEERVENAVFAMTKQDEFGGIPARRLAADLAPDGAARPCDEDALAA